MFAISLWQKFKNIFATLKKKKQIRRENTINFVSFRQRAQPISRGFGWFGCFGLTRYRKAATPDKTANIGFYGRPPGFETPPVRSQKCAFCCFAFRTCHVTPSCECMYILSLSLSLSLSVSLSLSLSVEREM